MKKRVHIWQSIVSIILALCLLASMTLIVASEGSESEAEQTDSEQDGTCSPIYVPIVSDRAQ